MDDDLWMVEAVIQPFKLDQVSYALQEVPGFGGMTISDCRGYGHGKLDPARDPAAEGRAGESGLVDFTPKLKLEVAVAGRATAERVVAAIARAAHTGLRGDGKVFAWPLAQAVRIRTGDGNASAL
jgi:nitrogen regulatory protein PII